MAEIKFTKNELRAQEKKLGQLKRYLPTLQLKKAMLQAEIYEARLEIASCEKELGKKRENAEKFSSLLSARLPLHPQEAARIVKVEKRYDNIAGVEVPYFESVSFEEVEYGLFDSPAWLDAAIASMRGLAEGKVRVVVAEEKKAALEEELRMVSIRVNLFEKILIPRANQNIKKIKVFLGDQELAAVSRAKVAKTKIEQHNKQLAR